MSFIRFTSLSLSQRAVLLFLLFSFVVARHTVVARKKRAGLCVSAVRQMNDALGLQQLQKLLVDGKSETRQKGAQTVAQRTSSLFKDLPAPEACEALLSECRRLDSEFLSVSAAPYRRAGMIATRAILSSLPSRPYSDSFLSSFTTLILRYVTDVDVTVRIAAVEACHELVRQLGAQVLHTNFSELFRALSCAVVDKDRRVALLAQEISSTVRELLLGDDVFSLDTALFIRFVCTTLEPFEQLKPPTADESPVVQWVLEWLQYVFDMPRQHLVLHMDAFLGSLLRLSTNASDGVVLRALHTCRRELANAFRVQPGMDLTATLTILASNVSAGDTPTSRRFCLDWLGELLQLVRQERAVPMAATLLRCVLPQLCSSDAATRATAQSIHQQLLHLVAAMSSSVEAVSMEPVLAAAVEAVQRQASEPTSVAGLEWVALVSHLSPDVVDAQYSRVSAAVLVMLCNPSAHVASKAVDVLCNTAGTPAHLSDVVARLLQLLQQQPNTLFPRLPMVLKQFQKLAQRGQQQQRCERLLLMVAAALVPCEDARFVSKCVVLLNTMLLTCDEFAAVRAVLRDGADGERSRAVFVGLFPSWKYSAVAVLSLCLLTRSYEMALNLCRWMGQSEVSPATLVQLDRMVQLLESPVFTYLRLDLLTPLDNVALVQTLFALLMILPQSSPQHATLRGRLEAIPCLSQLQRDAGPAAVGGGGGGAERLSDDSAFPQWSSVLQECREAQQHLARVEQAQRGGAEATM